MNSKFIGRVINIVLVGLSTFLVLNQHSLAAPGTLAQQPLFLGATVQPNIFFGIDDSGSMGAAVIVNNGAVSLEGFAAITDRFRSPLYYAQEAENYLLISAGGTPDSVLLIQSGDFDTARKRRLTCVGYNTLAYDPETQYTPWQGEDSAGNPYGNMTLAAARTNPYNPTPTMNISNFVFFEWTDADNDGEYDGPAATDPVAAAGAGDECGDVSSTSNGTRASAIPDVGSESPTRPFHNKVNFANWFTYYRSREHTAKRAVSELIFQSNARMGLGTLHDNNSVGTAVSDMTISANKDKLLEELSRVRGDGSTPTRGMYANIGRYFDEADTGTLNSGDAELGITNSSPILPANQGGTCQQNFAVIVSDGFWRNENEDPSGNDGFTGFGNEDAGAPTISTFDEGSHADGEPNTLADVAMHYYEKDLNTNLANEVKPIEDVDENEAQHLVGFTVAFGIDGTLTANPPNRTDPFTWPVPIENEPSTIDDMRHAAWNSRGEFLSAKNPQTLIDSLAAALNAIGDRVGTATAATFNSNTLDTGAQVFFTEFNSASWSGDVLAFDIDVTNGDILTPEAWKVSTALDAGSFNPTNRTVYTYDGTDGTLFTWASLTAAQQDDLKTNPDGSLETTTGFPVANARLDYLRGDRTHEATGSAYDFRTRASRLGDIIHSAPFFVSKPNDFYPNVDPFGAPGDRYADFQESTKK